MLLMRSEVASNIYDILCFDRGMRGVINAGKYLWSPISFDLTTYFLSYYFMQITSKDLTYSSKHTSDQLILMSVYSLVLIILLCLNIKVL